MGTKGLQSVILICCIIISSSSPIKKDEETERKSKQIIYGYNGEPVGFLAQAPVGLGYVSPYASPAFRQQPFAPAQYYEPAAYQLAGNPNYGSVNPNYGAGFYNPPASGFRSEFQSPFRFRPSPFVDYRDAQQVNDYGQDDGATREDLEAPEQTSEEQNTMHLVIKEQKKGIIKVNDPVQPMDVKELYGGFKERFNLLKEALDTHKEEEEEADKAKQPRVQFPDELIAQDSDAPATAFLEYQENLAETYPFVVEDTVEKFVPQAVAEPLVEKHETAFDKTVADETIVSLPQAVPEIVYDAILEAPRDTFDKPVADLSVFSQPEIVSEVSDDGTDSLAAELNEFSPKLVQETAEFSVSEKKPEKVSFSPPLTEAEKSAVMQDQPESIILQETLEHIPVSSNQNDEEIVSSNVGKEEADIPVAEEETLVKIQVDDIQKQQDINVEAKVAPQPDVQTSEVELTKEEIVDDKPIELEEQIHVPKLASSDVDPNSKNLVEEQIVAVIQFPSDFVHRSADQLKVEFKADDKPIELQEQIHVPKLASSDVVPNSKNLVEEQIVAVIQFPSDFVHNSADQLKAEFKADSAPVSGLDKDDQSNDQVADEPELVKTVIKNGLQGQIQALGQDAPDVEDHSTAVSTQDEAAKSNPSFSEEDSNEQSDHVVAWVQFPSDFVAPSSASQIQVEDISYALGSEEQKDDEEGNDPTEVLNAVNQSLLSAPKQTDDEAAEKFQPTGDLPKIDGNSVEANSKDQAKADENTAAVSNDHEEVKSAQPSDGQKAVESEAVKAVDQNELSAVQQINDETTEQGQNDENQVKSMGSVTGEKFDAPTESKVGEDDRKENNSSLKGAGETSTDINDETAEVDWSVFREGSGETGTDINDETTEVDWSVFREGSGETGTDINDETTEVDWSVFREGSGETSTDVNDETTEDDWSVFRGAILPDKIQEDLSTVVGLEEILTGTDVPETFTTESQVANEAVDLKIVKSASRPSKPIETETPQEGSNVHADSETEKLSSSSLVGHNPFPEFIATELKGLHGNLNHIPPGDYLTSHGVRQVMSEVSTEKVRLEQILSMIEMIEGNDMSSLAKIAPSEEAESNDQIAKIEGLYLKYSQYLFGMDLEEQKSLVKSTISYDLDLLVVLERMKKVAESNEEFRTSSAETGLETDSLPTVENDTTEAVNNVIVEKTVNEHEVEKPQTEQVAETSVAASNPFPEYILNEVKALYDSLNRIPAGDYLTTKGVDQVTSKVGTEKTRLEKLYSILENIESKDESSLAKIATTEVLDSTDKIAKIEDMYLKYGTFLFGVDLTEQKTLLKNTIDYDSQLLVVLRRMQKGTASLAQPQKSADSSADGSNPFPEFIQFELKNLEDQLNQVPFGNWATYDGVDHLADVTKMENERLVKLLFLINAIETKEESSLTKIFPVAETQSTIFPDRLAKIEDLFRKYADLLRTTDLSPQKLLVKSMISYDSNLLDLLERMKNKATTPSQQTVDSVTEVATTAVEQPEPQKRVPSLVNGYVKELEFKMKKLPFGDYSTIAGIDEAIEKVIDIKSRLSSVLDYLDTIEDPLQAVSQADESSSQIPDEINRLERLYKEYMPELSLEDLKTHKSVLSSVSEFEDDALEFLKRLQFRLASPEGQSFHDNLPRTGILSVPIFTSGSEIGTNFADELQSLGKTVHKLPEGEYGTTEGLRTVTAGLKSEGYRLGELTEAIEYIQAGEKLPEIQSTAEAEDSGIQKLLIHYSRYGGSLTSEELQAHREYITGLQRYNSHAAGYANGLRELLVVAPAIAEANLAYEKYSEILKLSAEGNDEEKIDEAQIEAETENTNLPVNIPSNRFVPSVPFVPEFEEFSHQEGFKVVTNDNPNVIHVASNNESDIEDETQELFQVQEEKAEPLEVVAEVDEVIAPVQQEAEVTMDEVSSPIDQGLEEASVAQLDSSNPPPQFPIFDQKLEVTKNEPVEVEAEFSGPQFNEDAQSEKIEGGPTLKQEGAHQTSLSNQEFQAVEIVADEAIPQLPIIESENIAETIEQDGSPAEAEKFVDGPTVETNNSPVPAEAFDAEAEPVSVAVVSEQQISPVTLAALANVVVSEDLIQTSDAVDQAPLNYDVRDQEVVGVMSDESHLQSTPTKTEDDIEAVEPVQVADTVSEFESNFGVKQSQDSPQENSAFQPISEAFPTSQQDYGQHDVSEPLSHLQNTENESHHAPAQDVFEEPKETLNLKPHEWTVRVDPPATKDDGAEQYWKVSTSRLNDKVLTDAQDNFVVIRDEVIQHPVEHLPENARPEYLYEPPAIPVEAAETPVNKPAADIVLDDGTIVQAAERSDLPAKLAEQTDLKYKKIVVYEKDGKWFYAGTWRKRKHL